MFSFTFARGHRRGNSLELPCGQRRAARSAGGVLTALVLAFATLVPGTARAIEAPWIVTNDMGGSLEQRIAEVEQMRAMGTPVRIVGTCVSACTLYLGLPNTCVMPQARLGFHGPSSPLRGIPLPRQKYEYFTQVMATYYPGRIRSWFMSDARRVTDSYYEITGRQAIAMGARSCV